MYQNASLICVQQNSREQRACCRIVHEPNELPPLPHNLLRRQGPRASRFPNTFSRTPAFDAPWKPLPLCSQH